MALELGTVSSSCTCLRCHRALQVHAPIHHGTWCPQFVSLVVLRDENQVDLEKLHCDKFWVRLVLPVVVRLVLLSVITSAGDFIRNSFDELEFFSQKFFLSFLQSMMMWSHMIPPRLEEHFLLLSRSDVSILQRHDAEVHWLAKNSLSSLPACLPAWKRDSQQRRI